MKSTLRLAGCFGVVLLFAPVVFFAWVLRRCGRQAWGLALVVRCQALWARWTLALLGVRLDVEGAPPRGPFVVVANHLSHLDIPVLSALFPGRFIAKSEIATWPGIGFVVAVSGTLFVRRGDRRDVPRMVAEMRRTLEAGVGLCFFPEGWASRGLEVRRFHAGLLQSAVDGDFPCLPVTLGYDTPDSELAPAWTVGWWGPVNLFRHVRRMLDQGTVVARVRWAPEPLRGSERKALAEALEAEVRSRFVPMRQERVPAPLPGDPEPEEGLGPPSAQAPGGTFT
ncbi:MAG: lysophospholipid acyltransferase family protein [Planctomycetota bacterium]|nr:lysophospholipid acyltransferase family protein [Planctomycetota bacterium]